MLGNRGFCKWLLCSGTGMGTGTGNAKWVRIKTTLTYAYNLRKIAFFKHLWDGREINIRVYFCFLLSLE